MRLCVLAMALAVLVAATAHAEPQKTTTSRIYDEKGRYQGKTVQRDGNARIYDAKGVYQGRIVRKENGDAVMYDAKGTFQGRIKQ